MPDTDIAAAARRVAEIWRRGENPLADDRSALLPVLDAVGAEPGEDRVERMAKGLSASTGLDPNEHYCGEPSPDWVQWVPQARAAIALADAERAAEASFDLAKASTEIDRHAEEISARVMKRREEFREAVREPKGRFRL